MATFFLSDLMLNGALPFQAPYGGSEASFTAVIKVPNGTDLAIGDELKIARIDADVNITEILFQSDALEASGNTLECEVGYVIPSEDPSIAYNATTNPAVTGGIGTADPNYYVVAAAAPFQDGGVARFALGQSGLDNEFANNPINGVDDIIDLAVTVSTASGGAITADKYLYVTVYYTGKTQTPGTFSGSSAYRYRSAY